MKQYKQVRQSVLAFEVPKKKSEAFFAQPQFVPEPPLESGDLCLIRLKNWKRRFLPLHSQKNWQKKRDSILATLKGSGPNERIISSDLAHAQPSGLVHFSRDKRLHCLLDLMKNSLCLP